MRKLLNVVLVLCVLAAGASLWYAKGKPLPSALHRQEAAPEVLPLPTLDNPAHLAILNGTEVDGLANTFGLELTAIGCVPQRVGNAPHRHYEKSILINRKLDDAVAAAIAHRLGGLTVQTEVDDRATEDAVLVVGADYQAVLTSLEAGQKRAD